MWDKVLYVYVWVLKSMTETTDDVVGSLRAVERVESVEDCRDAQPSVEGVSVQFSTNVTSFDEAREIVEEALSRPDVVRTYSNMTGVGDDRVTLLVEL